MDTLKRELALKRKAFQSDFGQTKYVKRSEIERKKLEQIRADEEKQRQRKQELQQQRQTQDKGSAAAPNASQQRIPDAKAGRGALGGGGGAGKGSSEAGEGTSEEDKIEQLQLSRAETIRRLRMLKHPVTLFGEDDAARLERLKHLMRTGDVDPDGELLEGQRNDFLRDMEELTRAGGGGAERNKRDKDRAGAEAAHRGGGEPGGAPEGAGDGAGGALPSGEGVAEEEEEEDNDVDAHRMKAAWEGQCPEDQILVFFKRLLREWKQELDMRPEAEQRTVRGKKDVATFKQCARYLDPMFKMCRRKQLFDDIRDALLYMVNKCRERDYLAASDKYIKLAIGNAPWPIGVTMVGIHERSAREKIHTKSVAHIMNDETTRKYLQSVKRLMTFCQRRYPALPSKSVEFNSLANGSDLDALLLEEAKKGDAHSHQALLRLEASKAQDRAH